MPIEGSELTIDAETVIITIGQKPNPLTVRDPKGLSVTKRDTLAVNPETQETCMRGVYAGGGIVSENATVISAIGAGKRAAHAIHKLFDFRFFLSLKKPPQVSLYWPRLSLIVSNRALFMYPKASMAAIVA